MIIVVRVPDVLAVLLIALTRIVAGVMGAVVRALDFLAFSPYVWTVLATATVCGALNLVIEPRGRRSSKGGSRHRRV